MDNKFKDVHWADNYAEQIIQSKGNKKEYIIESGITPSGVVHVGNFREVITGDLVRKALEKKGKKVKFLYVWDDYDVLRKVPLNLPNPEMIKANLRKPVFKVPDPYGCHKNYSEHFEQIFEEELKKVGIRAHFIYQHEEYSKCKYAREIKTALEHTPKIKEILNEYREKPLSEEWLPIFIFCENCGKDTLKKLEWNGNYILTYACECGHENTVDFRTGGVVTLRWRVDWPMRWHYYKVDFESAGKDHFAAGGSVTTGRKVQKEVFGTEPPFGFAYEWIAIKGGGQFASSLGRVITLSEMLEVYEPEIVRYIFAGTRPNREFSISFDADAIKIYEDFDRTERIYFGEEKVNEKKAEKEKVAYELSAIRKIPKLMPYQPGFRHLTMLVQIHHFDVEKIVNYYGAELKNDDDKRKLRQRAECAKNWVKKYAPEEFKFTLQEKCLITLSKQEKEILHELADKLMAKEWTDLDLHEEIYILCTNKQFPTNNFFKLAYGVLINKDKGPRLASFILEIGRKKVAKLFKKI